MVIGREERDERWGLGDESDPDLATADLATAARSASVCHPTENRKFTIKELKRIFGFPDDFVFFGNYKEQWARLGNCVPPPMIYFISKKIQQDILDRL